MTQDVEPRVIKQAGDAWREVHDEAAAAVNQLASVLQASAGMAGTDNGAHAWRQSTTRCAQGATVPTVPYRPLLWP
ncbi:hypothetical protein [Mycobacterium sp.]|uniref:hypothetical protein n=1 Tax=Mycobacterium sp. TaxID=1785 RepID=UPI0031D5CA3F